MTTSIGLVIYLTTTTAQIPFIKSFTFRVVCCFRGCFTPGYSYFINCTIISGICVWKKKLNRNMLVRFILNKTLLNQRNMMPVLWSQFNDKHVFVINYLVGENLTFLLFIYVTIYNLGDILFDLYEFQMVSNIPEHPLQQCLLWKH